MDLNYLAFFLISFVPPIIAIYWYHPNSFISKWSGIDFKKITELSLFKMLVYLLLSFALVYGYINLIIHQMGFYELFFTDIMKGSEASAIFVQDFMAKYGDKHRHFGHGVLHGALNAFMLALPFIGIQAMLEDKTMKYVIHHFSYWLITSLIIGGLISEFV